MKYQISVLWLVLFDGVVHACAKAGSEKSISILRVFMRASRMEPEENRAPKWNWFAPLISPFPSIDFSSSVTYFPSLTRMGLSNWPVKYAHPGTPVSVPSQGLIDQTEGIFSTETADESLGPVLAEKESCVKSASLRRPRGVRCSSTGLRSWRRGESMTRE